MSLSNRIPAADELLNDSDSGALRTSAPGSAGRLPLTEEMLRDSPSGDVFGLTQNAGMGWDPAEAARTPYLILSTHGGLRAEDGRPIALGYHTGHSRRRGPVPRRAVCPRAGGPRRAVLTDARFSGVSTGACLGHVSPEALAGGPIGKLRDRASDEIVVSDEDTAPPRTAASRVGT